jgi:hypothetical protein
MQGSLIEVSDNGIRNVEFRSSENAGRRSESNDMTIKKVPVLSRCLLKFICPSVCTCKKS